MAHERCVYRRRNSQIPSSALRAGFLQRSKSPCPGRYDLPQRSSNNRAPGLPLRGAKFRHHRGSQNSRRLPPSRGGPARSGVPQAYAYPWALLGRGHARSLRRLRCEARLRLRWPRAVAGERKDPRVSVARDGFPDEAGNSIPRPKPSSASLAERARCPRHRLTDRWRSVRFPHTAAPCGLHPRCRLLRAP